MVDVLGVKARLSTFSFDFVMAARVSVKSPRVSSVCII